MRLPAAVMLAAVLLVGCSGEESGRGSDDPPSTTAAPASTSSTSTSTTLPPVEGPLVIAHRGASASAPEHTFAAYDLALEQGADFIEQDLQMTADGELVVLHDPTLDRTARGPAQDCAGPVATKTLAQVQKCDAGSWFNELNPDRADPAFAQLRIPTMREVLDRYAGRARFYVETKAPEAQPGMEQALLDLLAETGTTDVIVQSFSAASLQLVHAARPELPLVLLLTVSPTPIDPTFMSEVATYASGVGPSSVNVDAAFVEAAHSRCLVVHPYTVDDPAEMDRLLDVGVDGMFSNTPGVLRAQAGDRPAPEPCVPG